MAIRYSPAGNEVVDVDCQPGLSLREGVEFVIIAVDSGRWRIDLSLGITCPNRKLEVIPFDAHSIGYNQVFDDDNIAVGSFMKEIGDREHTIPSMFVAMAEHVLASFGKVTVTYGSDKDFLEFSRIKIEFTYARSRGTVFQESIMLEGEFIKNYFVYDRVQVTG